MIKNFIVTLTVGGLLTLPLPRAWAGDDECFQESMNPLYKYNHIPLCSVACSGGTAERKTYTGCLPGQAVTRYGKFCSATPNSVFTFNRATRPFAHTGGGVYSYQDDWSGEVEDTETATYYSGDQCDTPNDKFAPSGWYGSLF